MPTARVEARTAQLAGAGLALAYLVLALLRAVVVAEGAPWERRWLLAWHAAPPIPYDWAVRVTLLGSAGAVLAVLLAVSAVWLLRRRRAELLTAWIATGLLLVLDYTAKGAFRRLRPALFPHPAAYGLAFPSGHSLFAAGFYGTIVGLWARGAPRPARRLAAAAWLLLALAVGVSRLILGVHWPTDVLAGYLAGAVVAGTACRIHRLWLASPNEDPAPGGRL
jgi:membrane-associated phospholipid phosphatase